jgi:hypothetical protein
METEKSINRNGCSFCPVGKENYTTFKFSGKNFYQYDFRSINGDLFTCTAPTLTKCRGKRDSWLKNIAKK